MNELRKMSIVFGVPENLRSLCWKLFLQLKTVDVNKYLELLKQGPCKDAQKI